jgi:hypothetical protein
MAHTDLNLDYKTNRGPFNPQDGRYLPMKRKDHDICFFEKDMGDFMLCRDSNNKQIQVAKPFQLRFTPFEGLTKEIFDGEKFEEVKFEYEAKEGNANEKNFSKRKYTYTDTGSEHYDDEVIQILKPSYIKGEVLHIAKKNTGIKHLIYQDLNTAGRMWSSPSGEISLKYNGSFTVKNISEYDESTGVFTGRIILCYGASYVAPDPNAIPPVIESYFDSAGYFVVNGFRFTISAQKFDVTAKAYVVLYSEITDTDPFIGNPVVELVTDIIDIPSTAVFVILSIVEYIKGSGNFGDDDFVPDSLRVTQQYKDGWSIYLPAFNTGGSL